ncbi:MAG: hypothetical protein IRY85_20625 [Micromonosporaceae bacterium]|nr:hypothetical protein [Micromonosporaceae bacterium]
MSVETRPRSTRDGGRGEPRASRPYRGYGAYTAGSTALRIDYAADVDELDADEPAVAEPGVRVGGRTPTRTRSGQPRPARIPRPRRRTPWITDVTPTPAPTTDAPPLPVSLPKAPFLLLMAALVVAGVVGVLVLHTKINEGAFRLSDLRANQASLDQQEQQLEQQLADLSSPGNLRAAATRLGLVPAGDPAYIYLPDGRVVGVPQPAWQTGP